MNSSNLKNKPKIKLSLSNFDSFLENLGWLLLVLLWILVIFSFNNLPDTIPTHFNFMGEPDGYGNKITIIILQIVATLMYIGLTILNQFPHLFNYVVEITEENAERQYRISTRMIRILKLGIVVLFGMISLMTIESVKSQSLSMIPLLFISVLALIIFPLIYFIFRSLKEK